MLTTEHNSPPKKGAKCFVWWMIYGRFRRKGGKWVGFSQCYYLSLLVFRIFIRGWQIPLPRCILLQSYLLKCNFGKAEVIVTNEKTSHLIPCSGKVKEMWGEALFSLMPFVQSSYFKPIDPKWVTLSQSFKPRCKSIMIWKGINQWQLWFLWKWPLSLCGYLKMVIESWV